MSDLISKLSEIRNDYNCFDEGEEPYYRALSEAIKILSQREDAVPRTSVEYICRKNTVSTNPYEHKYHDKFIQFMDDPEISDFGRWQHSNGFNTALVAVMCDLDKVPSAEPEIVKCKDCTYWDEMPSSTFTPEYHECVVHHINMRAEDFCSRARRRQDDQS